MTNALMASLQPELPAGMDEIDAGDTVRVHQRITEGRNERIQVFQGVVIAMRGGKGAGATYIVRRTGSHGITVERTFPPLQQERGKGRSPAQDQSPSRPTLLSARAPGQVRPPQREALHQRVASFCHAIG